MLAEHILFGLALALLFVNFFVKSRIVLPAVNFFVCVACILEIVGGSGSDSQWFQWAVVILAIGLAFQFVLGLWNYSTSRLG